MRLGENVLGFREGGGGVGFAAALLRKCIDKSSDHGGLCPIISTSLLFQVGHGDD